MIYYDEVKRKRSPKEELKDAAYAASILAAVVALIASDGALFPALPKVYPGLVP